MRSRRARLVLLCPILWSCGEASEPTAYLTVARDEIQPLLDGVEFIDVREVVLTDQAVWVLDGAAPFLTRLDLASGDVIRRGGVGQGPAEFTNPIGLQVDPDTRLVHVWDVGNRRHTVLDPGLNPLFSEPLAGHAWVGRADIRDVSYADPFRVRLSAGELLYTFHPDRIDRTADWIEASLAVTDYAVTEARPLVPLGEHLRGGVDELREFTEVSLWDACGREIVVWRPAERSLVWLDHAGAVVRTTPVDVGAPRPLGEADVAAYLERMARLEIGPDYEARSFDFAQMARAAADRFSDMAPAVVEMVCDPTGAAWLRLFDNRTNPLGRGSRWLAVVRAGESVPIAFPEGFRPLSVRGGEVLGSMETPQGAEALVEWRGASLDKEASRSP